MKKRSCLIVLSGIVLVFFLNTASHGLSDAFKDNIYNPGKLKPTDSVLKVRVGDRAPRLHASHGFLEKLK